MGEELWEMWCVPMCQRFIYIGHMPTLGCPLLTHLPCCYMLFIASENALILFLTHGGYSSLVSVYGKEKSCCHGPSLMGSLWAEHSISHIGTRWTGLG